MYNATEINIVLTDLALIGIVLLFIIYNILLIQLAPEIKKWIKEKSSMKSDKIGFK